MPQASLQLVFRTTAIAKLLYAAPAWWGFANASDRDRLEAFLRRAGKSGYQASLLAVAELCEQADDTLFRALRYNPIHPSIGYYHLSAVNHTSPVAVYILRSPL